ncbi:MAG TPA: hypothetical protein VHM70_12295 [Polyangiaceae bacterium]|nr:hypothetical protein [Polyangiaceae bacterium]
MLPFEDRYTRQRQLPEIGLQGHERIRAHRAVVGSDAASPSAKLYLQRAGVALFDCGDSAEQHSEIARIFEFEAARRFGLGCWRALSEVGRALGLEPVERARRNARAPDEAAPSAGAPPLADSQLINSAPLDGAVTRK